MTVKRFQDAQVRFNSSNAVYVNAASRALFGGGGTSGGNKSNVIDYVTITTTGNATDFGDLTVARETPGAGSSSTRGVFGGGTDGSASNVIDYVAIVTIGNATDFGDLTVARYNFSALSNSTRCIWGGGSTSGGQQNVLDYVTIATTGNATDFGDLYNPTAQSGNRQGMGTAASTTRGLWAGGNNGNSDWMNYIDYITIATTGNATNFGTLTESVYSRQNCNASSSTRGIFGGGNVGGANSTTVEYVTIASTGNATDFGDLTVARRWITGTSDSVTAVFAGGYANDYSNVIDYLSISSGGNATDFGDCTVTAYGRSACSGGHGGIE